MMYDPKTNERTFSKRERPSCPPWATTEARHAMAYATNAFKRLTGYRAENRHDHIRSGRTEADQAMAYARNISARMRGFRPDHPHEHDSHPGLDPGRNNRLARGGRMAGTHGDQAVAYARDLFRRLSGLPAQEPFFSNRRPSK